MSTTMGKKSPCNVKVIASNTERKNRGSKRGKKKTQTEEKEKKKTLKQQQAQKLLVPKANSTYTEFRSYGMGFLESNYSTVLSGNEGTKTNKNLQLKW